MRCVIGCIVPVLLLGLSFVAAAEPPRVVTTIRPIHSLVSGVTGDVTKPHQLIHGSDSPHDYALTTSDARALHRADIIFAAGGSIEAFLVRTARSLPDDTPLVWMREADGMILHEVRSGGVWEHEEHGDAPGHEEEHRRDEVDDEAGGGESGHEDVARTIDAHLWLDPRNAVELTREVAERLTALDPANAERYRANADRQIERLRKMDREMSERLAAIRDRPYIVFHDAFQYFERRYGLNVVGSVTVDPERPPGARRLNELSRRIEEQDVVCIFVEPQFEPGVIRTIADATGVRTGTLDPLGSGPEADQEAYFDLMDDLATGLEECLEG